MGSPATVQAVLAGTALLAALVVGCAGPQPGPAAEGAPALLSLPRGIEVGHAADSAFAQRLGGRLPDLAVQAYVATVGERIARSTPLYQLPHRFVVVRNDAVASYALPGGIVYVTRGFLAKLATESQLAAALARELAHVNARHVSRKVRAAQSDRDLSLAIEADARRRAGTPPPAAEQAALDRLVDTLLEIAYDADSEREADRLGLDYLAAAGYNPRGMIRLLEILAAAKGTVEPGQPPPTDDRAARVEAARLIVERKYQDRHGRVADEEYEREVLARL